MLSQDFGLEFSDRFHPIRNSRNSTAPIIVVETVARLHQARHGFWVRKARRTDSGRLRRNESAAAAMTKHRLTDEFEPATLVPAQVDLHGIDDDEPITLAEACKLFPRAKLTVSTLRAEAGRQRLEIFGIGKRDYTTLRSMREMVRRCREEDHRRRSTSQREINGSSAERLASAQAALNQTVQALKSG
jgi:hypothetical protein